MLFALSTYLIPADGGFRHAVSRSHALQGLRLGLDVRDGALLGFYFVDPGLEIVRLEIPHLHAWYEEGRLGEEVLHFLEWAPGRLGEDGPEEECVGKVADLRTRQL